MKQTHKDEIGRVITEALFSALEDLRDNRITAEEAKNIASETGAILKVLAPNVQPPKRRRRN